MEAGCKSDREGAAPSLPSFRTAEFQRPQTRRWGSGIVRMTKFYVGYHRIAACDSTIRPDAHRKGKAVGKVTFAGPQRAGNGGRSFLGGEERGRFSVGSRPVWTNWKPTSAKLGGRRRKSGKSCALTSYPKLAGDSNSHLQASKIPIRNSACFPLLALPRASPWYMCGDGRRVSIRLEPLRENH